MPPFRFITRTRLQRALRPGGCLQSKKHAQAMLARGRPLRCHEAHPPTREDEVAATQRWFVRVRPPARRTFALAGGRWNGGPSGPVGMSERKFYRRFAR